MQTKTTMTPHQIAAVKDVASALEGKSTEFIAKVLIVEAARADIGDIQGLTAHVLNLLDGIEHADNDPHWVTGVAE